MDLDKYRQAWQSDATQPRVSIDADVLLKVVQRDQQNFRSKVIWNDVVAAAIAILLLPVWIYMGITQSLPWTWYLTVPVLVWNVVFTLVYRMRCKQTRRESGEPLLLCVKESLNQVEDQSWLQRNLFWWNLLPLLVSILMFTAHVSLLKAENWPDVFTDVNAFIFVLFLACFYFLYYINQRTAETRLEPRRKELLKLSASLSDELSDESTENPATLNSAILNSRYDQSPGEGWGWSIVAASCLVIGIVIALANGMFEPNYQQPPQSSGQRGDAMARLVADLRNEKKLVGLGAMAMLDGKVEAAAAYGERKAGSGVPLEIGDSWHLGGITKSITATMIGRLVESGKMQWSDTLGEMFPEANIHEDWKPVTIRQLLTHSAGAPPNFALEVRLKEPALGPERTQARRAAILNVVATQPAHPPGTKYAYSNVGLTIAGAMAEQATGETWELLVEREVFEPLKLTGAGFGPPKSSDRTLQQPRGHLTRLAGKIAVAVADDVDNTPIMAPAANIRMTLNDLCIYATEHMRGELGEGKLLSAETYKRLHTPELEDYACGWVLKPPSHEIPHTLYWHNGSNTLWYALVVFIPDKNMVVAVTSNDGDYKKAEAAAWEIVKATVHQFTAESDNELLKTLPSESLPKKSPFAAVRWQENQPEVKVGAQWFKLLSLDKLPTEEMLAFSRQAYGEKWKKRFEEDLIELLSRMGHPPQHRVTLVVQSLTSGETQTLKDISITEENRRAIRNAASSK